MAANPKPAKPAPCCAAPVIVDTNDTKRVCTNCKAEWARETRADEWKPVAKK